MKDDAKEGSELEDNQDFEAQDGEESDEEAEETDEESDDESEEESSEESEGEEASKEEEKPKEEAHSSEESLKREKKKTALQNRINKLNKERYQALAAAKKKEEENAELRRMLDLSSQTAQYHFDNSLKMNLDKAKKMKEEAKLSGNLDAEVEADIVLAAAIQEYSNAEQWKQQQNLYNQYVPPQQQTASQDIVDYIPPTNVKNFDAWKSTNEWFEAPSDDFEEALSRETDRYARDLNNYLVSNGRPDMILSPEYFVELDAKVSQLKEAYGKYSTNRPPYQSSPQVQTRRSPLQMKKNPRPVTPVGNSRGMSRPASSEHVMLTSEQKEMARSIGMGEKEYAKYVMKFQRNQKLMRDQ